MNFSEFFKNKRQAIGTVRKFAEKSGYDAAYISRLENGISTPPRDNNKLRRLGLCLGLNEGTAEWQLYLDLAAAAKHELPEDLQNNTKITSVLPAFYRTLRKEQLDEKEIDELVKLIRKSGKED